MAKKTAVQVLYDRLWNTRKDKFEWYAILEQALSLEREQQQKDFEAGRTDSYGEVVDEFVPKYKTFTDYFNQNYGDEK